MGKLIIVNNDKVSGTDTHNIKGMTSSSPPVDYTGIGQYKYAGKMMTSAPSDFVKINGKPVALKTSKSSLDPVETLPPTGGHYGPAGSIITPPTANLATLQIVDTPIGEGKPGQSAGSGFVTIDKVAILLDGDKIDTCDGTNKPGNSTVTAKEQDFVSCSE